MLRAASYPLAFVLGLLASGGALGQPERSAARERELNELRGRIDALGEQLRRKEASGREARDSLRDSEKAISEANRRLRLLSMESEQLRAELGFLAERDRRLAGSLRGRQNELGIVLAAHQRGLAPDALRVLLSGSEPLEAARRLRYLAYLSRESAKKIASVREDLDELARVRREAERRAARLRDLSEEERASRDALAFQRRERRTVLAKLQDEIREGRQRIGALQADEARLARLVEELGMLLGARRTERAAPAEARGAAFAPQVPFSRLRGRLNVPVAGRLANRFPDAQPGNRPAGKGIFIRADEGEPVRAVGQGQVVFADWMRGFGNLLILDHGESYLSVYANNESLLKKPGDTAAAGEIVATVGTTGGSEKSGLYFELRHLGKSFDPIGWLKQLEAGIQVRHPRK